MNPSQLHQPTFGGVVSMTVVSGDPSSLRRIYKRPQRPTRNRKASYGDLKKQPSSLNFNRESDSNHSRTQLQQLFKMVSWQSTVALLGLIIGAASAAPIADAAAQDLGLLAPQASIFMCTNTYWNGACQNVLVTINECRKPLSIHPDPNSRFRSMTIALLG